MDNNNLFKYKMENIPEIDTISGNKRSNTKYNVALLSWGIALRLAKLLELYKKMEKPPVSSIDFELGDKNIMNEAGTEKELLLAIRQNSTKSTSLLHIYMNYRNTFSKQQHT